ncbi:MAG: hypothetical protein OMM_15139, partial [Candidatus Magnetoglobus multicellularis str. Araruama]
MPTDFILLTLFISRGDIMTNLAYAEDPHEIQSFTDFLYGYQKTTKPIAPLEYHEEPQSQNGLIVDEATFWNEYYEDQDFKYEWNDGKLEEKPMASIIG